MFKKISFMVIGVMLIAGLSYGAQATVTTTEYGYSVTGGTDETLVKAGRIRIRMISYTALTANNTARFRSGAVSGAAWYMKAATVSDAPKCFMYFGENGVVFDELSVTLSQAQDVVMIYN